MLHTKNVVSLLVISFIVLFAVPKTPAQREAAKKPCDSYLYERLDRYFSRSELRPSHIVNDDYGPPPLKPGTKKVDIGGVAVEFIYRKTGRFSVDVSVKIDGHSIDLKELKALNLADGDIPIEPNLVNKWNQIRLYRLDDDRMVIAISFIPDTCTGLMCSVSGRLYFDLNTKTASFFGAYRTDGDPKLYQFDGGSGPFVVAANFSGDPHGGGKGSVITYDLYRLTDNGRFTEGRDKQGRKYFLKHTEPPTDSSKPGFLESNWIEDINHLKQ